MAAYNIIMEDVMVALSKLEDNSFDGLFCDPPYHLTQESRGGSPRKPGTGPFGRHKLGQTGFAGQTWDGGDIAFRPEVWKEVLRVLKPGAYLLAFGGPRTFHRLTCAIEDAGFTIMNHISWLYGCLSSDTEILVDGEWKSFDPSIDGHSALCYDPQNNEYRWDRIEGVYEYDYKDTAFRIISDTTDQIVSRNHRCIVERDGEYVFRQAETLGQKEIVPILEGLQDLLCHLPVRNHLSIQTSSLLFEEMRSYHPQDGSAFREKSRTFCDLCGMRQRNLEAECMVASNQDPDMFPPLQWHFEEQGACQTCTQVTSGMEPEGSRIISKKNDGSKQSSLERWSSIPEPPLEQTASQICSVSSRVSGNVDEDRLCPRTQIACGKSNRSLSLESGSGSSYQSQSTGQQTGEPSPIFQQSRSQKIRGDRFTKTTLARVEPIAYSGKVWCVKVPTGAFVARRNGHIFVTGNSGMPKSLDISKAMDRDAGAERKVVGKYKPPQMKSEWKLDPKKVKDDRTVEVFASPRANLDITEPATEEAKIWDGYGTSLKPSWEPIVVAMKPLDGTYIQNAKKWGVAGLNLKECRTEAPNESITINEWNDGAKPFGGGAGHAYTPKNSDGRWPSNVMLSCDCEGRRHRPDCPVGLLDAQSGNSASRFFYCAKASTKERMDGTDGKNEHPCVKPMDLTTHLAKLICPPKGKHPRRILVPFSGSGSEMLGALMAGWDEVVGIENGGGDPECAKQYCSIANSRLSNWELQKGDLFE